MMTTATIPVQLTRKDFVSDQTVRWCPGCGDYSILAQIQKTLPKIGYKKEDIVFISGIGCSSRFPYYMDTYGIHSIHGRAPTLASGLAITNPSLSVWVVTGDGDGLSIGGNHLIHAMRRNVNLNIVLFNNRIYGLTKGQYSPTSRVGKITKSSPMGSLEQPINPIALALASGATFIARSLDAHTKHLGQTLFAAAKHQGTSFIETYQNCVIFNSAEWGPLQDRRERDDHIIYLEHGQPMVFGKGRDKGIRINEQFQPEVVTLGDEYSEDDLLVHNETSKQLAYIISRIEYPEFPAFMGVLYLKAKSTYTAGLMAQIETARAKKGNGDLNTLFRSADFWTVTEREDIEPQVTGSISLEMNDEYMEEMGKPAANTTAIQDVFTTQPINALMPKAPISVDSSASLAKAIRQMNVHNIGCLLVTDDNDQLQGIFTERDVLNKVAGLVEDLSAAKVSDFMTANPISVKGDLPIADALHLMSIHGFRHLPLVDDQKHAEGIISFRDVVRFLKNSLS
ncbi:MAG: thiamine pyrophosphate-dependent enzyme [Anaerolineae bacterium]